MAQQYAPLRGPAGGVAPVVATPHAPAPSVNPQAQFQVPLGFEVSGQHYDDLKLMGPPPFPVGGTEVVVDPGPPGSSQQANFAGPTPNGWIPYDAAVAVGPNHVLAMANETWAAYDKTGNQLKTSDLASFLQPNGSTAGSPFDPKCYYDPAGHFVMLATASGNSQAYMYLAVSQTSDPTGQWWVYQYDWTLDGTTVTGNWGDFPGLGYDDGAIYINANQYSMAQNSFQYAKVGET